MPKHIRTIMRAKGSHLFFFRSKYQTDDGSTKSYDVVSRDPNYNPNRSRKDPDAVTIFVLNKDHSQMLITHEFRYRTSQPSVLKNQLKPNVNGSKLTNTNSHLTNAKT